MTSLHLHTQYEQARRAAMTWWSKRCWSSKPRLQKTYPAALFVGDFNVGKSHVVNALLNEPLVPTALEETTLAMTAIIPSGRGFDIRGFEAGTQQTHQLTRRELDDYRHGREQKTVFGFLVVRTAVHPYRRLALVDFPGVSSLGNPTARLSGFSQPGHKLVVLVDVEYWAARHTVEFIKAASEAFEDVLVVANKSDQLNAHEIRRIRDRAPKRLASAGIERVPPFLTISARLESTRAAPDEYRNLTTVAVRDLCDAGFDQLRLHLHRLESQYCSPADDYEHCASRLAAAATSISNIDRQGEWNDHE